MVGDLAGCHHLSVPRDRLNVLLGVVALGLTVALTACSSSGSTPQPKTTTTAEAMPSTQTSASSPDSASLSSKATPSVTASTVAPPSLMKWLSGAGVMCPSPPAATSQCTKCTYRGEEVNVSTDSWTGEAALRHQACDAGYINKSYLVATDKKNLVLAPDYNPTARKLASALGIQAVRYCD